MDLSVTIPAANGGIKFKNPVMPAAATFGNIIEYREYLDLGRLGALMPNSIAIDTGCPTVAKKFVRTPSGFLSALARNNMSIYEFNEMVVPHLPWRKSPIIVNTKATDMAEMEQIAGVINDMEGIAGIEINLNCPYGVPGVPYWKSPEQLQELVRRVKAAAPQKVVFAKVPGSESPLEEIALACQEGGADAFTAYNSANGYAVDIRTRRFRCGAGGSGGYSGPHAKPIGLGYCHRAFKALRIPVIGVGGITSAADVLEYIMAGATLVQVGSANFTRPDLMACILDELEPLMMELGIRSLDEIRGSATPE